MAKRKRLTPSPVEPRRPEDDPRSDGGAPGPLETKSMFGTYPDGVWTRPRAPIAEVAGEASAVAALDEMGRSLDAARAEGRFLLRLRLEDIDEGWLVRDRLGMDAAEMEELVDSLRRRGQQTAIEVADLGEGRAEGRWGLISGWRRVTALRRLAEEGAGDGEVLAAVRRPGGAAEAYQAMVEENEIRAGLSHYERARIVARAADAGAYEDDRAALSALFAAASRPKRSKVGSFLRIVRALDDVLRFPVAIGERQGLALARALDEGGAERIRAALVRADPADAGAETAALAGALDEAASPSRSARPDSPAAPAGPRDLAPGLTCRETGSGLVLSGPALADPEDRARLVARLQDLFSGSGG